MVLLVGGILFASTSCTREELNIPSGEELESIPVSLSLSVAGMEAGTPETKAKMEPEDPDYMDGGHIALDQIRNFVVLQFDGTGSDAKLVGKPVYYPDVSKIFDGTDQVRLVPSTKACIIAVVANTFDNIYAQSPMTLGEFLDGSYKNYSTIGDYSSVFTKDLDNNEYLRMSGSVAVSKIDQGTSIELSLKRNVSKITINVYNNTKGADKVKLEQVHLRDINAKYYYLTNIGDRISATFKDNYSAEKPSRIDKDPDAFPADGNNGVIQTFTYYVPANLRGKNGSTAQYTKGLGAPEGATRFCLYGVYGSDNAPINYTYYLGEDLINDFNLKPNYHYTFNITLNSKGDPRYDYRIEDCKEVTFKTDANCYMVQPPTREGQEKVYAIPIRRAAVFWNDTGVNGGVYQANRFEGYSSYHLTAGSNWTAEVLWSDFKLDDPSAFLEKAQGKGYDPHAEYDKTDPAAGPYFKIKVKGGMKGNVIIGVRIDGSLVWSWHIWITDYNPDRESLVPQADQYIYDVDGGHVHRYNNTIFNTAPTDNTVGYKEGFIMDRNLGASDASYEGVKGTMYYQFGRKDPFVGVNQYGEYNEYFKYEGTNTIESTVNPKNRSDITNHGLKNIRYSIRFPEDLITSNADNAEYGWTVNDDLGKNTSIWLDDKFYEHTGDQESLEKKKSIYDPCPPGWKVPLYDAFDQFVVSNASFTIEGMNYHPKTGDSSIAIYLPAHSYLSPDGHLSTTAYQKIGSYWSATPDVDSANNQSWRFVFNTTTLKMNPNSYNQSSASPVRCVREYEYIEENYRQ